MGKTIAVMGGDQRQIALAKFLREDGWDTVTWGLEKGDANHSVPLDRALSLDILILPLPVCRGAELNLPLTDTKLTASDLWRRLSADHILLGGAVGALEKDLKENYGLEIWDYYNREDVQIANAIPTAEGAIMRMMEETDQTVQDSRCLVMGYGRIGKALAHRLQALGAVVTVAARKTSDLAWIRACGSRAVLLADRKEKLGEYDVIFNTVPALVLDESDFSLIKPNCLLVELASMPGGFDIDAVKQTGLQVIEERGLPGKVAPVSAARAIRDGIYRIFEERGVEV